MDEVHERDLDIDFAFIIIKHFLKDSTKVKLILKTFLHLKKNTKTTHTPNTMRH